MRWTVIHSLRTLRFLKKQPHNINILSAIKMTKELKFIITRAEVIRGSKMDPHLTPKLDITAAITAKVMPSASSFRAKIFLRRNLIRKTASQKTTLRVK